MDTADITCPLPVEHAGVVLARVGDAVITGCDVALAWEARTREGYRVDDPRVVLGSLVTDALMALARPGVDSPTDTGRRRGRDVDRALAEALLRAEALADLAREQPDEAAVARFHEAHREDFALPERVHLREVVLPNRAAAEAVQRELAAGVAFETVVERTIDPAGRRDGGDLGFIPRAGAAGVPAAVAEAGFALAAPGDVTAVPLRVITEIPVMTGRRHPRRLSGWHVVQLIQRLPGETLTEAQIRRRIVQRLTRDRYITLRREARARWQEALRGQVAAAIEEGALGRVRVAPR